MSITRMCMAALLLSLTTADVMSQDQQDQMPLRSESFSSLDIDGDGVVNETELGDMFRRDFHDLDVNNDGEVTREEYQEVVQEESTHSPTDAEQ